MAALTNSIATTITTRIHLPIGQSIANGQSPFAFRRTDPIEHYNDFGFTIGGPLNIPKVYQPAERQDLLFLVGGVAQGEYSGTTEITVPTAAELGGVFSTAQIVGTNIAQFPWPQPDA